MAGARSEDDDTQVGWSDWSARVTSRSKESLGAGFWRVWTATTTSNVGDGILLAALPLLAATLTRDPVGVAAATIAIRLPWLVFGLFAGVLADRTDRLRLMIITDLARAVGFVGIAFLVATDQMTLPALYAAVFAVGIAETIFDTAAMSLTPALVERDQLERANARINSAVVVSNEFAGPPLGGLLFAVGVSLPFGVNAATFALSAVLLATIGRRYRRTPVPASSSISADIRSGFRFLWNEPIIRAFAVGAGVINLGFTAVAAVLVLHAQDNLGLDNFSFGLLLAGAALGSVLGAQAAPTIIRALGRRTSVVGSVTVAAAGVAAMGIGNEPLLVGFGFAVFGFAGEIWNILSITYRQTVTPDEILGRVMAGFRVIAYGAFPFGALLGGLIATTLGLRAPFFVGAALIAIFVPYLITVTARHSLDPDS